MGKKEKTTKLISVMVSATLATGMVPAAAFAQQAVNATGQGGSASSDQSIESVDPTATEIAKATEVDTTVGAQLLETETPASPAMSGDCGATESDQVTWALTQNNDGDENPTYTLTISGEGAMADYSCNIAKSDATQPWRQGLTGVNVVSINNIVVEEGVTSIGAFAFNGVGPSVSHASFDNCLTYKIADSVETIGSWAVQSGNVGTWTGAVAEGCKGLMVKDGVLYTKDGSKLIDYPGAADAVKSFEIPSGVTEVAAGSFNGCDAENVVFPDGVKNIGGWLFSASTTKSVSFGDGLKSIGTGAFSGVSTLENVDFRNEEDGLSIGDMAFATTGLQSVALPAGVTFVGDEAFKQSPSLSEVIFEGKDTGLSIGKQAFLSCPKLEKVTLPEGVSAVKDQAFQNCKGLESVVFGGASNDLVIGSGAFTGTALSSVEFPAGIKEIGSTSFNGLSTLKTISFAGDVSADGLTIDRYAFQHASGLVSVRLPEGVKKMGEYCFSQCQNLKQVEWPTAHEGATIETRIFKDTAIEKLVIPEGVTTLEGASIGEMGSLKYLKLPSTVSSAASAALHALPNLEVLDAVALSDASDFHKSNDGKYDWVGSPAGVTYVSDASMVSVFPLWWGLAVCVTLGGSLSDEGSQSKTEFATISKKNMTFGGWYSDAKYQSGQVSAPSSSHTTYYAKWNSKITLDANGGALGESDSSTLDVAEGGQLGELPTPTREGYKFGGWFTEKGAGEEVGAGTVPAGNATYYAHWVKTVDDSKYYVNPVVADQTYTGKELKPAIAVTKNGQPIDEGYSVEYADNVNAGTATATVKVGDTVIGTASFTIRKAVPAITLAPSPKTLWGGGTVTLAVTGAPDEGELSVSCSDASVSIRKNEKGEYVAFLPNATKDYTFTASYTPKENGNYEKPEDATAAVHVDYYDPSYPVSVDDSAIEGGSVEVSPKSAVLGQKVTLTPKADAGHVLGDLAVKDAKGNELELVDNGDGTYSFKMPSSKVTVEATFPVMTFPDVDYSQWYAPGVDYMAGKGLMTGYSDTGLFGVGKTLTRGELATILWRNACPDEAAAYDSAAAKDETGIAGSADGMFYTAAANWAVANGVITGVVREDGSLDFAATEDVTFEQLVTILARLCAEPGAVAAAGSDLSAFTDGSDASAWSAASLKWAAGKGLVEGYDEPSGKRLAPGEDVARERVATVLMRAFDLGILK